MAAGSVTVTGNFGGSRTATVNPTAPPVLAVFSDPAHVHDVRCPGRPGADRAIRHGEPCADLGGHRPEFFGYPVSGTFIGSDRAFQVRFGTEAGERRAYFTETGPDTICDIDVVNGQLVILPTNVRVPGGG